MWRWGWRRGEGGDGKIMLSIRLYASPPSPVRGNWRRVGTGELRGPAARHTTHALVFLDVNFTGPPRPTPSSVRGGGGQQALSRCIRFGKVKIDIQ